ncbi:MAG: ArgE/DapE family deacylase [candidate division Zixibacteria bacterium]|nr:ArgE/DapE family deacylase [candidate division Zixibacteria bacterium]
MKDHMLSKINVEEIGSLIQELVRIPTKNPPGMEKPGAEFIVRRLREWGIQAELVPEPYEERPQAWAQIAGTGAGPTLVLNGHIDVVPEGDTTQWEFPPFEGTISGGRVYGRGACDTKGGLAAMMITAKILKEMENRLQGRLLLHFAVGEEKGEPGTKHLLLKRRLRGDYGIVLEPTGLRVATAEKGLAWFRVGFQGRPVHGSVAEQGINAINKAVMFAGEIMKYNEEISHRIHHLVGNSKCSITMINGGTKENVIPESCNMVLDRRINPEESVDAVENEIRSILNRLASEDPEFKYTLQRTMVYESAEIPTDAFLAQVVRKHAAGVAGVPEEPYGTPFSTDVRNFINDADIDAITFGPGDPNQPHTFTENIKIDEVARCVEILLLTAEELLTESTLVSGKPK